MTNRVLIVKCKTKGCDTDLKVREVPPDGPRGIYRVPAISVVPDPGELTCPDCNETHSYLSQDIEVKIEASGPRSR